MKKIVFYNHFKNGDVHLSRGFVKYITSQLDKDLDCYYYHRNNPCILQDIPNLKHITDGSSIPSHLSGHVKIGDTYFINTWYGCNNYEYMNRYGLTFDAIFANFNDACKLIFNTELKQDNYLDYFPTIDFSKFEIEKPKEFVAKAESTSNKLILVANGPVHSGQATNFNLSSVVYNLAKKYKGLIFLLTDKSEDIVYSDNIFYTSDIINKHGNDLNENAWFGTQSDFIIGRASGVFSFCITKEIIFNRNNSFVSFSNLNLTESNFWLGDIFKNKIKYTSKMYNYDCKSSEEAMKLLTTMLDAKYEK